MKLFRPERRANLDEAKFFTQKVITYAILFIFASVVANIFLYGSDPAERSTVLQTVINFTMLAIGFWLGSSKGSADNRDVLNKLLPTQDPKDLKTEEVKIDAQTATVTTETPATEKPKP